MFMTFFFSFFFFLLWRRIREYTGNVWPEHFVETCRVVGMTLPVRNRNAVRSSASGLNQDKTLNRAETRDWQWELSQFAQTLRKCQLKRSTPYAPRCVSHGRDGRTFLATSDCHTGPRFIMHSVNNGDYEIARWK